MDTAGKARANLCARSEGQVTGETYLDSFGFELDDGNGTDNFPTMAKSGVVEETGESCAFFFSSGS